MYSSFESRCLRFVLFDFLLYICCCIMICFINMRGWGRFSPSWSILFSLFFSIPKCRLQVKCACDIFQLVLAGNWWVKRKGRWFESAPVQPCVVRYVDRRHQSATRLILYYTNTPLWVYLHSGLFSWE